MEDVDRRFKCLLKRHRDTTSLRARDHRGQEYFR